MRLKDLLADKLIGMFTSVYRKGEMIKSVYGGMKDGDFVIQTDEELAEGEEVELRISFGGWNFVFPGVVRKGPEPGFFRIKPKGKVRIIEKRREKRVPTVIKCSLSGERGVMLDVSYHGTRVLTLTPPQMESEANLIVDGKVLKGQVRWIKDEGVDLKSVGLMISDPPTWWTDLVKRELAEYVKMLRRL